MNKESYGARIERGIIIRAEDDLYAVQSATRDGITTPPIHAILSEEYLIGDRVYFFIFDDGDGMILGKMR